MLRKLTKVVSGTTLLFSISSTRASLALEAKDSDKMEVRVREDRLIKNAISPHPMSACDIVKALLRNDRSVQQVNIGEKKYPPIEFFEGNKNKWDEMNPILLRSKCACDFGMVIDPRSLGREHSMSFISKDDFNQAYQDTLDEDNQVLEKNRQDSCDLLINSRRFVIR